MSTSITTADGGSDGDGDEVKSNSIAADGGVDTVASEKSF